MRPAHCQQVPRHSNGAYAPASTKSGLACKPSEVEAWLARAGSKPISFRRYTTNARAELYWSNLHAGPDFVEAGAYAPVRRDAHPQVKKLTGSSLPGPFPFLISQNPSCTGIILASQPTRVSRTTTIKIFHAVAGIKSDTPS